MAGDEIVFTGKAEVVANTLRREIQRGMLKPGDVLRQRALATRFGVSPTPVREALSSLEAEGFVVTELHRGASVVRTTVDRLWENALIRGALEVLAVELAIENVSAQPIAELREINHAFAQAGDDAVAAGEANQRFHFRMYEMCDAPVLHQIMKRLWNSLDLAPNSYRQHSESVEQHGEIIDALERQDRERAVSLIQTHVGETTNRMKAALDELTSDKSAKDLGAVRSGRGGGHRAPPLPGKRVEPALLRRVIRTDP